MLQKTSAQENPYILSSMPMVVKAYTQRIENGLHKPPGLGPE